jgi:ATP-dependent Zn protease
VIGGRKLNGRVWGYPADCEDDLDFFGRCVELVAGAVGEKLFLGESKGLRGSDKRKAHRCASWLCESDSAVRHLIRAAEAEAAHVLLENEHVIEALVTELCEKRTMDGNAIIAVINRTVDKSARAVID